jgi:anti-sigma B factor antagonist
MSVPLRKAAGVAVVVPVRRIDSHGAELLETDLRSAAGSETRRLVVDMSSVDYIGSKGLQALVAALVDCRRNGGDLKLAGVTPNVLHVLRITMFDKLFPVCSTVEAAVDNLGGP